MAKLGYASLNYDNLDLRSIMPWCGTHEHAGPESIVKTFVDLGRYWEVISLEPMAVLGSGEYAAMFERFTSCPLVTTQFAVFAKVKDGHCYYLQFMEDTLATSASFKSDGQWTFHSNPDGGELGF